MAGFLRVYFKRVCCFSICHDAHKQPTDRPTDTNNKTHSEKTYTKNEEKHSTRLSVSFTLCFKRSVVDGGGGMANQKYGEHNIYKKIELVADYFTNASVRSQGYQHSIKSNEIHLPTGKINGHYVRRTTAFV